MVATSNGNDVAVTMTMILTTLVAILVGLIYIQDSNNNNNNNNNNSNNNNVNVNVNVNNKEATKTTATKKGNAPVQSTFFPCPTNQPSKYAYEKFCAYYSPIWMSIFAIIVAFQLYEDFDAMAYNLVCLGCALPFLLQPIILPSAMLGSPDAKRPFFERYSTKANLWLFVYSFIGNYWYTHYFYSVLNASYTMPSTRLNNVPIAFFFATHFYFSSYHVFSNTCLRKIKTTYQTGLKRKVLYIFTVLFLSYFTAFMETLTISSFPYYSFEDRDMAYTIGSAFYGIYFIVSFPAFLEFDEDIDAADDNKRRVTLWDTFKESCGYGMMILCLLDFVRLYIGIPLIVGSLTNTLD
jgi:cycloeucalenol cycloisomerase